MKTFLALAVSAAALAATAATASASVFGGPDLAVGHGSAIPCPPGTVPPFPGFCSTAPRDFQIAAVSNLAAGRAAGFFSETGGPFCTSPTECVFGTFRGRVLCVTAVGNVATIGVVVEKSTLPTMPEGAEILVSVVDNGRSGDPLPDLLSLNFTQPVLHAEGQCLETTPPFYQTVVDGDIVVRDGQVAGTG